MERRMDILSSTWFFWDSFLRFRETWKHPSTCESEISSTYEPASAEILSSVVVGAGADDVDVIAQFRLIEFEKKLVMLFLRHC